MVHPFVVTALKTATLLFGGLITFFALRAYRKSGARPLGLLALGFGVVTLGSLLAGVVDILILADRQTALVIESGLTAAGFGVIAYSLYARA
jgi:hypothetical protein